MEKREETNVCWARCAALTDCHKNYKVSTDAPIAELEEKKCRLRR